VRDHLRQRIEEVAKGVAGAMRATADYEEYGTGYPPIMCDPAMVDLARAAAADVVGAQSVVEGERGMGGEDFSFVAERVPSAFIRLGTRDPSWDTARPAHSPFFDLSEAALPLGVAVMASTALRYLDTAPAKR
jgi:metal-dependent amidase/aminoacylase/carboxypeptidase family protein